MSMAFPASTLVARLFVSVRDEEPQLESPTVLLTPTAPESTNDRLNTDAHLGIDRWFYESRSQHWQDVQARLEHGWPEQTDATLHHFREQLRSQINAPVAAVDLHLRRDPEAQHYQLQNPESIESLAALAMMQGGTRPATTQKIVCRSDDPVSGNRLLARYTQHAVRLALATGHPLPRITIHRPDGAPMMASDRDDPSLAPTLALLDLMHRVPIDEQLPLQHRDQPLPFIEHLLTDIQAEAPLAQRTLYLDTLADMLPMSLLHNLESERQQLDTEFQPDALHILRHSGMTSDQPASPTAGFSTRFFMTPPPPADRAQLTYNPSTHRFESGSTDNPLLAAEADHRLHQLLRLARDYLHCQIERQAAGLDATADDPELAAIERKAQKHMRWFEDRGIRNQLGTEELMECLFYHCQNSPATGAALFSLLPALTDSVDIKAAYARHLSPLIRRQGDMPDQTDEIELDPENKRPSEHGTSLRDIAKLDLATAIDLFGKKATRALRLLGYDSALIQRMMRARCRPDTLVANLQAGPGTAALHYSAFRQAYQRYLATGDSTVLEPYDDMMADRIAEFYAAASGSRGALSPESAEWVRQLQDQLNPDSAGSDTYGQDAASQIANTFGVMVDEEDENPEAVKNFRHEVHQKWLRTGTVDLRSSLDRYTAELFPGFSSSTDLGMKEQLRALGMVMKPGDNAFRKALIADARDQSMKRAYRRLQGDLSGAIKLVPMGAAAIFNSNVLQELAQAAQAVRLDRAQGEQVLDQERQDYFDIFIMARYNSQAPHDMTLTPDMAQMDEGDRVAVEMAGVVGKHLLEAGLRPDSPEIQSTVGNSLQLDNAGMLGAALASSSQATSGADEAYERPAAFTPSAIGL